MAGPNIRCFTGIESNGSGACLPGKLGQRTCLQAEATAGRFLSPLGFVETTNILESPQVFPG